MAKSTADYQKTYQQMEEGTLEGRKSKNKKGYQNTYKEMIKDDPDQQALNEQMEGRSLIGGNQQTSNVKAYIVIDWGNNKLLRASCKKSTAVKCYKENNDKSRNLDVQEITVTSD